MLTFQFGEGRIISCVRDKSMFQYVIVSQYIKICLSSKFLMTVNEDKPTESLTDISILCCWFITKKSNVGLCYVVTNVRPIPYFRKCEKIMGMSKLYLRVYSYCTKVKSKFFFGLCRCSMSTAVWSS